MRLRAELQPAPSDPNEVGFYTRIDRYTDVYRKAWVKDPFEAIEYFSRLFKEFVASRPLVLIRGRQYRVVSVLVTGNPGEDGPVVLAELSRVVESTTPTR